MHGCKRGSSPVQIVSAVAWLIVALGVWMLIGGCDAFPADAVITPGSFTASVGTDPVSGLPVKTATMTTPGYRGPGSGATTFNVQTPSIEIDGIKASGTQSGLTLKNAASNPWFWLYVIGGLVIVGGLIATQFLGMGTGLGIAAAGAAFLVFIHFLATYPLLAFGLGALLIAGLAFWYIQGRKGKDVSETLRDVVKSVGEVGGEAAKAVKDRMLVNRHSRDTVVKVIDERKP